jgi:hypothetical protein
MIFDLLLSNYKDSSSFNSSKLGSNVAGIGKMRSTEGLNEAEIASQSSDEGVLTTTKLRKHNID